MTRLFTLALAVAALTGCIIIDRDDPDTIIVDDPGTPPVVVNASPFVFDGAAGCYYDAFNADDILYLNAWVDDPDGTFDVVSVWADVYDDRTGELVQSLELFPTNHPQEWFSDWLVSTTWFDCWYPFYSIDLVAYDTYDAWGVLTVVPATY